MSKFVNCVRFIVQEGKGPDLLKAFEPAFEAKGMEQHFLVQTGDREYLGIGVWDAKDSLVAARPIMIAFLDTVRPFLDEISPELGVTDPRSGFVVWDAPQKVSG